MQFLARVIDKFFFPSFYEIECTLNSAGTFFPRYKSFNNDVSVRSCSSVATSLYGLEKTIIQGFTVVFRDKAPRISP